jgi:hypothetical protein
MAAAKDWVGRYSRLLPLSWTTEAEEDSKNHDIDPIRDLIIPNSEQFQHLRLMLPLYQVLALFALPAGDLEALETLYVKVTDAFDSFLDWKDCGTVFRTTSRLHSVYLQIDTRIDPHMLGLPWSQLRELHLWKSLSPPFIPFKP